MSEFTPLTAIRSEVDEKLVRALESWLADAKNGTLFGAVLLGNNRSGEYQFSSAGDAKLSIMMVAFEAFKLDAMGVRRE